MSSANPASAAAAGRVLVATAVAVVAALTIGAARADAAPQPQVVASFDALIAQINGITGLTPSEKRAYTSKLQDARRSYVRDEACSAAGRLGTYLNHARDQRRGSRIAIAEHLFARGFTLRNDVLATAPPVEEEDEDEDDENEDEDDDDDEDDDASEGPCGLPFVDRQPQVDILVSNNQTFETRVALSMPRLWTAGGGGESWTQLEVPGVNHLVGEAGLPAIPVWSALIAIPHGSTPRIAATPTYGESLRLNLYPFQEEPVDGIPIEKDSVPPPSVFANRPFRKSTPTYGQDRAIPASPCSIQRLGRSRDVEVAQVVCAAGRYNPVRDLYQPVSSMRLRITFAGVVNGTFTERAGRGPFESNRHALQEALLNRGVLDRYVLEDFTVNLCGGEELLILVPAVFMGEAERLAEWKRDKGIATTVVEVGDGEGSAPDTTEDIDSLIEDRYNDCGVRPSYVLLFGDAEHIPTWYVTRRGADEDDPDIGTDYPYATDSTPWGEFFSLNQVALPSFSVGRIPVDTVGQAETIVDKIITYESAPPTQASFYDTAAFASQFQCCRTDVNFAVPGMTVDVPGIDQRAFVETAELIRDRLLTEGYAVDRIYTTTVDEGDEEEDRPPYLGDPTPRLYYNGRLLPPELAPESGFSWNGNTEGIQNAFRAGRFLVFHRDHGWRGGFAEPAFDFVNAAEIDNGALLPVVFSVNCSSGMFDNETNDGAEDSMPGDVLFAERLLQNANGGAVGVIGDTRISPTWANNALARGFFDAVFPNVLPEYGDNTRSVRLGDIVNYGKLYLFTQSGQVQTAGSISPGAVFNELNLWHALGDPTLELWTDQPLSLPEAHVVELDGSVLSVDYAVEGAVITAFRNTEGGLEPMGRGTVSGGRAVLPLIADPEGTEELVISASREERVARRLTPRGSPVPTPR